AGRDRRHHRPCRPGRRHPRSRGQAPPDRPGGGEGRLPARRIRAGGAKPAARQPRRRSQQAGVRSRHSRQDRPFPLPFPQAEM
ncbi:hypothetical protein LTR94_036357, partial [Friedmanniomyces endolithicus]